MTNQYVFSASTLAFYPVAKMGDYKQSGMWPDDVVEVTDEVYFEYLAIPDGKKRGTENGLPCWIDIPPPTHDELVAASETEKQRRINEANYYINNKQWPGKAAIGRLKGDDLAQYNRWLDYLDLLEAANTSTAPDISWPVAPTG